MHHFEDIHLVSANRAFTSMPMLNAHNTGIDKLFKERLQVPITIASNPLTSVVEGTGIMLNNIYLLER